MLECEKRESYAIHNVWGFLFNYRPLLPRRQILHIGSAFCVRSIKASPVLIAYKTAELFAFFEGSTQRGRTIGSLVSASYYR